MDERRESTSTTTRRWKHRSELRIPEGDDGYFIQRDPPFGSEPLAVCREHALERERGAYLAHPNASAGCGKLRQRERVRPDKALDPAELPDGLPRGSVDQDRANLYNLIIDPFFLVFPQNQIASRAAGLEVHRPLSVTGAVEAFIAAVGALGELHGAEVPHLGGSNIDFHVADLHQSLITC